MGNRILKDSIRVSESLGAVSMAAENLFYKLIVCCDDLGRFYADACIIKGHAFCRRGELTLEEIESWLDELEAVGLVCRYTVQNTRYLYLPGWEKHQKLRFRNERFPKPPVMKETEEGHAETSEETNAEREENAPVAQPSHARINNNIIYNVKEEAQEEVQEEVKEEAEEEKRKLDPPHTPRGGEGVSEKTDFELFWEAYPRKECRPRAEAAFLKLSPTKPLLERILSALSWFCTCDQWNRDAGRYVPHPSNFLRERRWEEVPDTPHPTKEMHTAACANGWKRGSFDTDDFFATALTGTGRRLLSFAP